MNIIDSLKGKVIVSSQAMPDEPFYKEECMLAMMQDVINGGAQGLRVAGARDVRNAKKYFSVPVIGITKPTKLPENWKEVVYITPTVNDVRILIDAGADIIAFDGTFRPRESGCTVEDIIKEIHSSNRIAMADISTEEEGIKCSDLGADIISTTLAGYTVHSGESGNSPDFDLLKRLVYLIKTPIILEGRIQNVQDVKKAFDIGAHSVVIGSAITRPHIITRNFVNYKNTTY